MELQKALASVVLQPVNAEKGEGPKLAARYSVRGYPTFVLVDASGEEIDRIVGYGGSAAMIDALAAGLADPVTIGQRQTRLAQQPNVRDAVKIGQVMLGRGEARAAVASFRQAAALDPADDQAFPIFEALALGFRRRTATLEELRAAADAVFARPDRTPAQLLTAAHFMNLEAQRSETPALRHPYLEQAVARTADVSGALVADRRALLVEHALHVEGDRERAVVLKRQTLPPGWQDDARRLNQFAWWCFENRVNLAEAEELARRGAELATDNEERAQILDTLAEIRLARGNPRGALVAARQAAVADPANADYQRQVDRFTAERRRSDPSR